MNRQEAASARRGRLWQSALNDARTGVARAARRCESRLVKYSVLRFLSGDTEGASLRQETRFPTRLGSTPFRYWAIP
ncbi:hypothetical protein E2C01_071141 [Portunus trituberculatus]|uniref:Uncharacterized protein n=1 Tax=Portunus trituberculatus TaxID=210409 RepID=A0A5B7I3H7_PORTR|nr:hypothetical protein [Portunus trituberculatus]